jgi:hypothetical protein
MNLSCQPIRKRLLFVSEKAKGFDSVGKSTPVEGVQSGLIVNNLPEICCLAS